MVPSRNEAALSDPGNPRPDLPDPQHDEHVAFPDDATVGDGRTEATSAASGATLPPEAWAPRPEATPNPPASSTSGWQPDVRPGSILTTPPTRPHAPSGRSTNGSTGAKLLAGLVLVPVLLGFFSSGSHDDYTDNTDGGISVERQMGGDMPVDGGMPGSAPRVWVEPLVDTSSVAGPLAGSSKVQPVPADVASLRAEIVGESGTSIDFEAYAGGVQIAVELGTLPYAAEVHLDQRPATVHVTATDSSGTGQLQCRVYAGDRLVAVSNGSSTVTCSPKM